MSSFLNGGQVWPGAGPYDPFATRRVVSSLPFVPSRPLKSNIPFGIVEPSIQNLPVPDPNGPAGAEIDPDSVVGSNKVKEIQNRMIAINNNPFYQHLVAVSGHSVDNNMKSMMAPGVSVTDTHLVLASPSIPTGPGVPYPELPANEAPTSIIENPRALIQRMILTDKPITQPLLEAIRQIYPQSQVADWKYVWSFPISGVTFYSSTFVSMNNSAMNYLYSKSNGDDFEWAKLILDENPMIRDKFAILCAYCGKDERQDSPLVTNGSLQTRISIKTKLNEAKKFFDLVWWNDTHFEISRNKRGEIEIPKTKRNFASLSYDD
jgi:hypothetical protein